MTDDNLPLETHSTKFRPRETSNQSNRVVSTLSNDSLTLMKWSFLHPYISIPPLSLSSAASLPPSLSCSLARSPARFLPPSPPPSIAHPLSPSLTPSLPYLLPPSLTPSLTHPPTHNQPTNQSINQSTNQSKKTIVPIYKWQLTFINSFKYSHIHTRLKWDLHTMTQQLLHSFIHPHNFTYSLTHLISHTSDRTLTKSPTHPFIQTFACLLNYSHLRSIHTFYPFIHTFIQSPISKEIAHDDSLIDWIIYTLNQPSIRHDEG